MVNKCYILILAQIILFGCSTDNSLENMSHEEFLLYKIKYVENPESSDTLCISDIEKAKKDIKNGKIVFTEPFGFGTKISRSEEELKELCSENGLIFEYDLRGCVVYNDQTQGCYGTYMDKVIISKHGLSFKDSLKRKAESLFLDRCIKQNKVIEYWDCDERPRLPYEEKRTSDFNPSINISNLEIMKEPGKFGGWPFFDLGFIVEKDSTISNFHSRGFVPHRKENETFHDELLLIAIEHIKSDYPLWVPGKIDSIPIRTDNNVRIHFIKQ